MTARSHTRTRRRVKARAATVRRLALHRAQARGDQAAADRIAQRREERR